MGDPSSEDAGSGVTAGNVLWQALSPVATKMIATSAMLLRRYSCVIVIASLYPLGYMESALIFCMFFRGLGAEKARGVVIDVLMTANAGVWRVVESFRVG